MKTYISKYLVLAILAGTIFTTFEACKIKNPTEGIAIYMKPEAVSAPNSYSFITLNGTTDQALEGVEIEISGPSAPFLYTSDGSRTFNIVAGQIGICVRKGLNPSPGNPIVFDIHFSAPGYLSRTIHQELTSLIPINQAISVASYANLPKTSSKKDTTFSISSSGLNSNVNLTTPKTDSLNPISLNLPLGTKFLDASGNAYSGSVSSEILISVPSGKNGLAIYPFDILKSDFKDELGNPVNKVFLPSGIINLSFKGGGKAAAAVWADTTIKITPFSGDSANQLIVDKNGTAKILKTLVGGTIPSGTSINVNGVTAELEDAKINFQNFAGKEYLQYWDVRVVSSYGQAEEISNPYDIYFPSPFKNYYYTEYMNIHVVPGNEALSYKKIKNTTDNPVLTRILFYPKGAQYTTKIITIDNNDFTLNDVGYLTPPGIRFNYISQFSVYCEDQSAYMVLPEGWPLYLIKKSVYESTIIPDSKGGHKVQPSDNTGQYIQVNASKPIEQNGKLFNQIKIPMNALEGNTEYIACTIFGSQGLIFNNFKGTNPGDKLITPINLSSATSDIIGPVTEMRISKCSK